jgi:hypothetical protein
MRKLIALFFATGLAFAIPLPLAAAEPTPQLDIHFIWFGGDDCPPCVAWRNFELPKLKQFEEFKSIRYSYVIKAVHSPIPPKFFLPPEVAPLKEKLDIASGGRSGSPKGALVVNGEIFDFFRGVRSAEEIRSMIRSVQTGSAYPFKRCVQAATNSRKCEVAA